MSWSWSPDPSLHTWPLPLSASSRGCSGGPHSHVLRRLPAASQDTGPEGNPLNKGTPLGVVPRSCWVGGNWQAEAGSQGCEESRAGGGGVSGPCSREAEPAPHKQARSSHARPEPLQATGAHTVADPCTPSWGLRQPPRSLGTHMQEWLQMRASVTSTPKPDLGRAHTLVFDPKGSCQGSSKACRAHAPASSSPLRGQPHGTPVRPSLLQPRIRSADSRCYAVWPRAGLCPPWPVMSPI